MVRTKLMVRRSYEKTRNLPAWVVNEDCRKKRTIYPFKIKQTLPKQKTVNIDKDGQIAKTINVRVKSNYFNGNNRLIF